MDNPTGWVENQTDQIPKTWNLGGGPWSWHGNCCWRSFLSFSPPGIKKEEVSKKKPHLFVTWCWTLKNKVFYNQNKDHLGAIYIYTYTPFAVCSCIMHGLVMSCLLSGIMDSTAKGALQVATMVQLFCASCLLCFSPYFLTILFSEWRVS